MGVTGKLEIEVGNKASGDLFYNLFGGKHDVTHIIPRKIHAFHVLNGDFGKPGSVIQWDYTLDGKKCVAKEIVEEIDEEKKFVKFKLIEGSNLLEEYKSMMLEYLII
ncbi:hypothetical protein RND81_08G126600, partial [Saponaria officinalis]